MDRQELHADADLVRTYVYCGQLNFINGEWRWHKFGFANDIVITEEKSLGYSSGVSLREYLEDQGNTLHSLRD